MICYFVILTVSATM